MFIFIYIVLYLWNTKHEYVGSKQSKRLIFNVRAEVANLNVQGFRF